MARPPVASNRWSPVPFTMCAIAIAGALSACTPVGGDNTGTAGTGSPGTGGSGSGNAGTTGNGGSGSGVAGTTGIGGSVTTGTGGSPAGTGGSTSGTGGSGPGTGGSDPGTGGGGPGTGGRGGTTGSAGSGAAGRGGTTGGGGTTGSAGTTGSGGSGPVYNPNFKEFYGDDCTVADPKDVNITELPNLFTNLDGTTMSKRSDWRCRRAELVKIVEKYIHGPKPGKPDTVTGTVSSTAINVSVTHMGKSTSFSVSVSLPTGTTGPVPIIIGMGGSSLDSTIVKGEGVATGTYDHQSIASETSRSGKFTTIYGTGTGASAQVGWAWGISRVIDVLVAEKAAGRNNIIDPTAVGITGCSRNGKAAFTVGAWDERIALGIPQESGTGGVSAFRVVNTAPKGPNNMPAQSLASAWSEAQGWFGTVFQTYTSGTKVNMAPGDTSSLVAMYAPRGLLVLDNSRIGELCSTCQHAASVAGQKLYAALGVGANISYNGGNPTDPHNHCTFYPATQGDPLKRAIRAHLTKTAAPDGRMEPQPAGTADLTKWVPWTAPALTNDVSWASPPLTK
jgi:Glucuronyl esterase, fungi